MIEYIKTAIGTFFNLEMMLWGSSPTTFILLNGIGILFSTDAFLFNNKYLKRFFRFTEKIDSQNRRKEKQE